MLFKLDKHKIDRFQYNNNFFRKSNLMISQLSEKLKRLNQCSPLYCRAHLKLIFFYEKLYVLYNLLVSFPHETAFSL